MTEERQELFSEKVKSGSRTYFFDVKKTKEDCQYLVISESKAKGNEFEHHRIMIFQENIQEFLNGLNKAIDFLSFQKKKESHIEEIRLNHPRAYSKWTPLEDEQLQEKYCKGINISELSQYFQRKPGAIRSRIKKLGIKTTD